MYSQSMCMGGCWSVTTHGLKKQTAPSPPPTVQRCRAPDGGRAAHHAIIAATRHQYTSQGTGDLATILGSV